MRSLKSVLVTMFTMGLMLTQCLTLIHAQSGGADAILPKPTSLSVDGGAMQLTPSARIIYSTRSASRAIETSLKPVADVLAGEIEIVTGFRPAVVDRAGATPGSGDIALEYETISGAFAQTEAEEDQSYRLTVGDSVVIQSQYSKGVAYGTTSLVHALQGTSGSYTVPAMRIDDSPASAYRAVMIDVARQRHTADSLKDVVRLARQYKVRYVHLHVTDDQFFVFPFTPVTDNLANNYTISRSEWVDLVSYADARGVTIIPELDLPGHSTRLRQSGYLNSPADNDADVAAPHNYGKIQDIISDMLDVFQSTPYFHIGGDESGAGSNLVPFLGAMNQHIRSRGRRMLVWEGFHGAPVNEIPATGSDRVIVMSWESTYNAPWDLLNAGYTLINASWRPLYLVGHGTPKHPGTGVRSWPAEEIYAWDADTFQHWEPGRPVYQDAGPNDPNRGDSSWKASYIGRQGQMMGGQLLFWEATDQYVIAQLRTRLPALAERLWNPAAGSYAQHESRLNAVDDRVMSIVRPIDVQPVSADPGSPMNGIYRIYSGDSVDVTLTNRTNIAGDIRYETDAFDGALDWIHSGSMAAPSSNSPVYQTPFGASDGFAVRAQLYRSDGSPVDGVSWEVFNNWSQRLEVREYRRGRDEYPLSGPVPDLNSFNQDRFIRSYRMPSVRGPLNHVRRDFQLQQGTLNIENAGSYTITAQSQSGRATVYVDLNRNGQWESNEAVIRDTPPSEQRIDVQLSLDSGQYPLRIDHMSDQPRSALIIGLSGPDTNNQRRDISFSLEPLGSEPPPESNNIALGKAATESSLEGASDRTATQAVDGNLTTRWASQYSDPQWMQVDLAGRYNIERVVAHWETAHGRAYQIQVSDNATDWQTIYSTTSGDGGTDDLSGLSGTGRYIRMYGTQRGTQWGYSLWEFEVYGSPAGSDPAKPSVSVASQTVAEDAGSVDVLVSLSEAASVPVRVSLATGGDSARPSEDFYGVYQQLEFAPGETDKRVSVTIVNDTVSEGEERFVTRLFAAQGLDIGVSQAFITITDDDGGSPSAAFSVSDVSVDESAGSANVVVTLSEAVDASVSIHTRAQTARGREDYYGFTRKLSFSGGQRSQSVPITILDDTAGEPTETLLVRLFDATGAAIRTATATVTINDDDASPPPLPLLSINDLQVDEAAGSATLTVSLDRSSSAPVSVNAATTLNGTATPNEDFVPSDRTLTFPAGTTTQSFEVSIVDDATDESDETVDVTLSSPQGAQIADNNGVITIADNDDAAPPPGGGGRLSNIKSGLCLAVRGGDPGFGTDIVQSNCEDVSHQLFTFRPRSDGYGNIQAGHVNGCLTVRSNLNEVGQPIENSSCIDQRNHVWAAVDSWDNRERIQFKSRLSGMCLTVKDGSTDDGAILVQEPCRRGDSSQLWDTAIADDHIVRSRVAGVGAQSHGVQGFHTFGDGVIQQDAWTAGDISFYFPRGRLTDVDVVNQWLGWYVRVDQLYRLISARPNFDSVFRANDPNFGRKKVLGVVEGPTNTCGTINAAGCGSKQQAQASSGYVDPMLRDPWDYREHWIFFYEMGRGGSPELFYGRATWPVNTVIFPHTMAGIAFHVIGDDAGLERGIPGLLLDGLVAWEHSGKEFVQEYATKQSHDLIAAMLYRILQDNDADAVARIMRNMEAKPQPSNAVQAMCDFQDAVNQAVSGFSERMRGPWGLPDNC